jgi:metal-responsive CopG/Arc/MetJ family transcriptional regulator
MSIKKPSKSQITIQLPPILIQKLDKEAEEKQISRSEVIRNKLWMAYWSEKT